MTIGVFDTGMGGEFVTDRLQAHLPEAEFITVNDRDHLPYGNKTPDEITEFTEHAIAHLLDRTSTIVIACNTATAYTIDYLRDTYPRHSFVGFEPMVKPAVALSHTKSIAILATYATKKSDRYKQLKLKYGKGVMIVEPNTNAWAELIEQRRTDDIDLSELSKLIQEHDTDIIALACTHYLDIELTKRLYRTYGEQVKLIDPVEAVATQIKKIISYSR